MKNCDEMVKSLFERRDRYIKERKKRRKTMIGITSAVLCVLIVCSALIIPRLGKNEDLAEKPEIEETETEMDNGTSPSTFDTDEDIAVEENTDEPVVIPTDDEIEIETDEWEVDERSQEDEPDIEDEIEIEVDPAEPPAEPPEIIPSTGAEDFCIFWWKNKLNVYGELYFKLNNDPDSEHIVTAVYRPTTGNITDFFYEGESISQIAIAAYDEKNMPEKMMQLLKQGDDLKYGTALYETGNADGVKWDKNLYEETAAYLGSALLDKYIVNGEFLREQLEADIANYNETSAQEKYERAYDAYMETVLDTAIKRLSANNIKCQKSAEKKNVLTITVTAAELENIPLDDVTSWYFS